jgi:hypothetical protein
MNDDDRDGDMSDLLEAFFEAMRSAAEEGDVSGHGRVGDGSTRIDFDYTVRTGMGPGADGRRGHPRFGGRRDADRAGVRNPAGPAGSAGHRDGESADRPVHVDTTGDGRTVTVDLMDSPVSDAADVTTAVEDGTLSVRHRSETVATAPLDDGPWAVADAAVNNGVLRVEIEDA